MVRSSHLSFSALVELDDGLISAEERERSLAHLEACSRCAKEYRRVSQMLNLMRTDDAAIPPPAVIQSAIDLFRSRPAPASKPTMIERLTAALRLDSFDQPLAMGLRSSGGSSRQLLFSAGSRDIDVRLTSIGEQWRVAGQQLGQESIGRVELRGEQETHEAFLNEWGEFAFAPVPQGRYLLVLYLEDQEITLPPLDLGPLDGA